MSKKTSMKADMSNEFSYAAVVSKSGAAMREHSQRVLPPMTEEMPNGWLTSTDWKALQAYYEEAFEKKQRYDEWVLNVLLRAPKALDVRPLSVKIRIPVKKEANSRHGVSEAGDVREAILDALEDMAGRLAVTSTIKDAKVVVNAWREAFFPSYEPRNLKSEVEKDTLNWPIVNFAFDKTDADDSRALNFDAPYQRGSVWSMVQKQRLIESILMEVPIGAIYINTRPFNKESDDNRRVVVDGKQRLLTIKAFMNNEFEVPAEWWRRVDVKDNTAKTVKWSGLTEVGQFRFMNFAIATYETKLQDAEAEELLFDLINQTGTPHEVKPGWA